LVTNWLFSCIPRFVCFFVLSYVAVQPRFFDKVLTLGITFESGVPPPFSFCVFRMFFVAIRVPRHKHNVSPPPPPPFWCVADGAFSEVARRTGVTIRGFNCFVCFLLARLCRGPVWTPGDPPVLTHFADFLLTGFQSGTRLFNGPFLSLVGRSKVCICDVPLFFRRATKPRLEWCCLISSSEPHGF